MQPITAEQLISWQSNSIDRIASLNAQYLGVSMTAIALVIAIIQITAYKISNKRLKELESKIKSDIEKKLVKDILGPPRVGKLVKINDTIFLITENGKIGFVNEQALRAFNYDPSSAVYANPSERGLPEVGTINEKKEGFATPLDQVLAESKEETLKDELKS